MKSKFYEKTWGIVLLLIVFFPVGLYLMWKYSKWSKNVKIIVSAFFAIAFINAFSSDKNNANIDRTKYNSQQKVEEDKNVDNKDKAKKEDKNKTKKEEKTKKDEDSWTMEQKNAFGEAQDYIMTMDFSKQGLIDQLSSKYGSNYPKNVAKFAVNKLEEKKLVDWNEQAVRSAKNYLATSHFSKNELIQQLSSSYGSKFTKKQAEYAVKKVYK